MTLLIAFALLSIAVSFICSVLEAALLSITPSYIAQQKLVNPRLHDRLSHLKEQIDQPLAAILTLNTVAHTVGATGVGAQVAIVFGSGYLGIASAVMTLLILVLSEIIPKTIGARYWPVIAPFMPITLNSLITLLRPFIWLSDQIMKLFGGGGHEPDIRQEIKALTVLGREQDKLDDDEQRVIGNILDLHDVKVKDIMTPRTVCEVARPDELLSSFIERVKVGQFSRYPVLDGNEVPMGMVFRHELLNIPWQKTVSDLMKPLEVVSEKLSVEALMSQLIHDRQHMRLVYDEYGVWLGLVTLEDVIEAVIGQPIMDETDDVASMRHLARRRWQYRQRYFSGGQAEE